MLDMKKFYQKVALYLLQLSKVGVFLYGDGTDNYQFKSGTKNIKGLSNYALLAIKPYGAATWLLASNTTNVVRGCGGVSTGSNIQLFACSFARSGDDLTYLSSGWTYPNGNNAYNNNSNGVACIIGLIPIVGGVLHSIRKAFSHRREVVGAC